MRVLVLPFVVGVTLAVLSILPSPAEAFFGSECGNNSSHNLFIGHRSPYDRMLYTNHTYTQSSFWGRTRVDVEFPPRGQYPRGTINYIEVRDQFRNGNGGCASLRRGGVGLNYAKIRLTSRWNSPMEFYITVWGR